MQGKPC